MGYDSRSSLVGAKVEREILARVRPALAEGIGKGMKLAGEHWKGAMQRRFKRRSGGTGSSLPGTIHRRSSLLANSIGFRVQEGTQLADVRATLFVAGAKYGRAQQFGAIIRPKTGKFLAIPGKANLNPSGVPRKSSARAWWSEFERTGKILVVKSKKNPANRVVLWRATERSKWQHWWTLVPEVTIPGPKSTGAPSNLAFYETWHLQIDDRAALIRDQAQKSLNRAGLALAVDVGKVRVT